MSYAQEIAKTIWNQIRYFGGIMGVACWGVEQKAAGEKLSIFLDDGKSHDEPNVTAFLRLTCTNLRIGRKVWVYVGLTGADDYTLVIVKSSKRKNKENGMMEDYNEILHRQEMLYFDDLFRTIDGLIETGTLELNYGK